MTRPDGERSLVDDARDEQRTEQRGGVVRPVPVRGVVPVSQDVQTLEDAVDALLRGRSDLPERVAVPLAEVLARSAEYARQSPGAGWTYAGDVNVARAVLAGVTS